MGRRQVLERLGFSVGKYKMKRVIIVTDIKAEADDPYAIMHHLLSPTEDVRGIVACHSERKYLDHASLASKIGTSADTNYAAGEKILSLADMQDVPLVKGCTYPMDAPKYTAEYTGADLIIEEALKEEEAPLFIACQGALTDVALALNRHPEIAGRMTLIAIAGAAYPQGGLEPNMEEDIRAAQICFASNVNIWQIPMNVYSQCFISIPEIMLKIKPCGEIGAYLAQELLEVNDWYGRVPLRLDFPHGEMWSLGDNPTVTALMTSGSKVGWHMQPRPTILDDMTYGPGIPDLAPVRVYDWMDHRFGLDDFVAKLTICYRESRE